MNNTGNVLAQTRVLTKRSRINADQLLYHRPICTHGKNQIVFCIGHAVPLYHLLPLYWQVSDCNIGPLQ